MDLIKYLIQNAEEVTDYDKYVKMRVQWSIFEYNSQNMYTSLYGKIQINPYKVFWRYYYFSGDFEITETKSSESVS